MLKVQFGLNHVLTFKTILILKDKLVAHLGSVKNRCFIFNQVVCRWGKRNQDKKVLFDLETQLVQTARSAAPDQINLWQQGA